MAQYILVYPDKIIYPKMACIYTNNGIVEFPNLIPMGFEPDVLYDIEKDNVPVL